MLTWQLILAGLSNKEDKEVLNNIQLRFIENCRFRPFNLDKFASNLNDDQCKHIEEFYKGEKFSKLMMQKGVYLNEQIVS